MKFEYNENSYEFTVKKIGREHCLPQKKHERRARGYHSLHFIRHGWGSLLVDGKKVMLSKGSLFLLYAGENFEYYPDSVEPWSYIWIDFYGDELDGLFEACGFSKEKPYIRVIDYAEMEDTMIELVDNYNDTEVQDMVCSAYSVLLFSQLIKYQNRNNKANKNNSTLYKQFRETIIYINNNYRMNLTLEQIEEDMCVTERQLLYMFKIYVGLSPINYINKFRISNACELLKQSDLKIKTIAEMVGVEDEKYFMRMFMKWKGMSADEYRQNCLEDNPFDWLKEKNIDFR